MAIHRPIALIILDGWGYREDKKANAIALAETPFWDQLWKHYPHTLIEGCGRSVGLPKGQMGNSEVGHLNMGAGRIVQQDLTRIDLEIENNTFFSNPILTEACDRAVQNKKAIHILVLLSEGGVHSHEKQLYALLKLAAQRKATTVYIHAFLDGRDTPPQSAKSSLIALQDYCQTIHCGKLVSIIGRYFAMDRDKRWDRIQIAYDLLTKGKADFHAEDAIDALELAYQRGETDEFVSATAIHDPHDLPVKIEDNDSVIFMNFRADRAREMTRAFIDPAFNEFNRSHYPKVHFVTLTEYDATFDVKVAYPKQSLKNILSEYASHLNLKQLRIAETEKYAHVTFFFNGGIEKPFALEDRVLIPSPKVRTYDLKPEMSAYEVTDKLIEAINQKKYDIIISNFANPDMVGHTGNLAATIKAIETIDRVLSQIIPALQAVGGEALITADHGNAEVMFDENTRQPHTAHTNEKVPLVYVGRKAEIVKHDGILSDIAPTMLYLLGLPIPNEMTGQSIFKLCK